MNIEETLPPTPEEVADEILLETSPEAALEAEPAARDKSKTMTFKRSHVYAALLPLVFVIGLSVGYLFWGRTTETNIAQAAEAAQQAQPQAAQAEAAPQEVRRYDVPEDDDPVWGSDDAPVTIIEFSDYECPYCQKWHVQIWPQIQAAYPDQVRLVFRDFPLTQLHANAVSAAAAANCANEQDAYWEFNELLFSGQSLNKSTYAQFASDLNLEMEAFTECLESGRQNDEVMADYEYAANLGVSSTPTFFVNGIPVVGAQPFEVFQQIIEAELAGEVP